MELIEDLGLRPSGDQGNKMRWGLYECPVCNKHFECRISDVKRGKTTKCRSCADKAKATKAASEFIEKARAIHGDLYEYLIVDYVNSYTKVKITCPVHGVFEQTPTNHLNGQGCPHCAIHGFDKNKSAILYYLKVSTNDTIVYKIGITNRTVQERFNNEDLSKITILKIWSYPLGTEAYAKEQEILKVHTDYKYTGKPLLSSGSTELFTVDVLGLDEEQLC